MAPWGSCCNPRRRVRPLSRTVEKSALHHSAGRACAWRAPCWSRVVCALLWLPWVACAPAWCPWWPRHRLWFCPPRFCQWFLPFPGPPRPLRCAEEWGTWASRAQERSKAGGGRLEDGGGAWAAKTVNDPATTTTTVVRQLLGTTNAQTAPTTTNTATTGHRERGNDTSRSTVRSDRQHATTQRSMRREERVTVQGPVKKQWGPEFWSAPNAPKKSFARNGPAQKAPSAKRAS